MKSSRGSWDSSVTQLLKLKASAGPVWLLSRVPVVVVVLAPASRPWKYCQDARGGGTGHPPTYPEEPASFSSLSAPLLAIAQLTSAGAVCPVLILAPGTQSELDECSLN